MIFRKGPLVGFAVIAILLAILMTVAALPARDRQNDGGATEVKLVDTCPQGYLLHRGNHYMAPGSVCVPGYLPSKNPANASLKSEGRQ